MLEDPIMAMMVELVPQREKEPREASGLKKRSLLLQMRAVKPKQQVTCWPPQRAWEPHLSLT